MCSTCSSRSDRQYLYWEPRSSTDRSWTGGRWRAAACDVVVARRPWEAIPSAPRRGRDYLQGGALSLARMRTAWLVILVAGCRGL